MNNQQPSGRFRYWMTDRIPIGFHSNRHWLWDRQPFSLGLMWLVPVRGLEYRRRRSPGEVSAMVEQ